MYNFAHAAFHSTPGHVWLCGRQTQPARRPRTTIAPRTTARTGRSPPRASTARTSATAASRPSCSARPTGTASRSRSSTSAIWLTSDGGQSFTPSTYTNEQTGQARRTTARGLAASGRGAPDDVRRGRDRQLLCPGALARRRGDLGSAARHRHQVGRQPDRLRSRRPGLRVLGAAPQHQPRRRRLVADVGPRRRLRGLGLHAHGAGDGERAGALRARPRRQRLGGPPLARPRGDLDGGAGDALRQPQHLEQVRALPRASARPERALHPRAGQPHHPEMVARRAARRRAVPSWI